MVAEILRPKTLGEAARLASMPGTAVLGGGTWLNATVAAPDRPPLAPLFPGGPLALVSLENLGLDFVEWSNAALRLGAAATLPADPRRPGRARGRPRGDGRHRVADAQEHGHHRRRAGALPARLGADPGARGARRPGARRRTTPARHRGIPVAARAAGPVGLIVEVTASDADRPCAVASLARTSHGRRSLVIAVCRDPASSRSSRASGSWRATAGGRCSASRTPRTRSRGPPLPAKDRIENLVRAAFWPTSDIARVHRVQAVPRGGVRGRSAARSRAREASARKAAS